MENIPKKLPEKTHLEWGSPVSAKHLLFPDKTATPHCLQLLTRIQPHVDAAGKQGTALKYMRTSYQHKYKPATLTVLQPETADNKSRLELFLTVFPGARQPPPAPCHYIACIA